jgi:hypothetical protein
MYETIIFSLAEKKYPIYKNKKFSISYFGAQVRFYDQVANLLPNDCTTYIDLVAGGNGTPYQLLKDDKVQSVVTNDLSFYSYVCSKTVFENRKHTINELLDMLNVEPLKGYLSNLSPNKSFSGYFTDEMRNYIDGYCTKNKENSIALAAMGKLLIGKLSFRSLMFSRKLVNGKLMIDYSIQELINDLYIKLCEFNIFNIGNGKSYNLDANEFVQSFNEFEGNIVYADPAWPFTTSQQGPNPYVFSSEIIPSILLQKESTLKLPWNNKSEEDEQKIYNDISLWIRTSLNKGAKMFIINTQSTNFPLPEKLNVYLRKNFNIINYKEHIAHSSLAKTTNFTEYWWVITK